MPTAPNTLLLLPDARALRAVPQRTAVIRLHQSGHIMTSLSGPHAHDRQELEQFIHDRFRIAHGANIKHYLPQLMCLRDGEGKLLAVCGLRHADEERLFLENYLDAPIEQVLYGCTGEQVSRRDIVEVGNLAVANPAHVRSLLASVSVYLHGTHTQWAVFTGLASLRNSLEKLNIRSLELGEARLARLPVDEQADWGTYYAENPLVMAVHRVRPPQEVR